MPTLTQTERDQIADKIRQQTLDELEARNVNTKRIAQLLDEELQAMETRPFKGSTKTVTADGGIVVEDKIIYSDPLIAHGPRLKAAELAIALLDIRPSEKHQVSGNINHTAQLSEQDREIMTTLGDKLIDAILQQHRNSIAGDPAGD